MLPLNGGWQRNLNLRRLVYKIQERNYGESPFLLHPRPQEDELLSSWLVRVALEHFTAPATFTNLYLPEWKNMLWAEDLDLQADSHLLEVLAAKSSLSTEKLLAMTLRGYEGFLFEQASTNSGATPYILPLRVRGRHSNFPGLRFCPLCLSEDNSPYFRRKWRLSFSSACTRHVCFLLDRCQQCGKPFTIYRLHSKAAFPSCSYCGFKLSDCQIEPITTISYGLSAIEQIYDILDAGTVNLGGADVYSFSFFKVIHQLSKVVYFWERTEGLLCHEAIVDSINDLDWAPKAKTLATIPLKDHYFLFSGLMHLMDNYPKNLITYCSNNRLGKTELTKDMQTLPSWYAEIVDWFTHSF